MGRKRSYTDDDRERARVIWEGNGHSLRGTARDTGFPLTTIQTWAAIWEDPPPAPLAPPEVYEAVYESIRTDKKAEAIAAAWDAAKAAFEQVALLAPTATDIQKVATAAGIAVDKAQLLSGAATERTEHNVKAIVGILPPDLRAEVLRMAEGERDA